MTRYRRSPETILRQRLRKIQKAGLKPIKPAKEPLPLEPLEKRIQTLFEITKNNKIPVENMLFLVMYDIENDKVRTEIAKYLIRKGCIRIQKSVYIANLKRTVFDEISKTLKEVQQMYENNDSILLIPVSTDELKAMKIIGQNIDVDLILGNRNTLFF